MSSLVSATEALARRRSFIAVVGHGPDLDRDEGAASTLRALGAEVRQLDLWDDPARLFRAEGEVARAILIEAVERPDLAVAALRALRREARLDGAGAIIALSVAQVARLDPASGFDDFVLYPYVPAELYARVRRTEWTRSEFSTEERLKLGSIVIDKSAHEVSVGGRAVALTAKEFALVAFLAERRGRVVSRSELYAKVWGQPFTDSTRTVDIHVRRLRAKLGSALPLVTLRGSGYKLRAPDEAPVDDAADEPTRPGADVAEGDG